MRATLLVITILSGCATLDRNGRRVPDDDLIAATADDPRAQDHALRAAHARHLGLGGLLLGSVLLAGGASLLGFGDDHHQSGALAIGATLTAVAGAAFATGAALTGHAEKERERAIVAYDADALANCR